MNKKQNAISFDVHKKMWASNLHFYFSISLFLLEIDFESVMWVQFRVFFYTLQLHLICSHNHSFFVSRKCVAFAFDNLECEVRKKVCENISLISLEWWYQSQIAPWNAKIFYCQRRIVNFQFSSENLWKKMSRRGCKKITFRWIFCSHRSGVSVNAINRISSPFEILIKYLIVENKTL